MPRLPAIFHLLLSAFLLISGAMAAPSPTALGALKLLPKDAAKDLASIHGFEGQPGPERWHILIHDPKEANGLREFIIAKGELVGSHAISQFAEQITVEQVIGGQSLKIDSDRAAKMAQEFAMANKLNVVFYDYDLRQDAEEGVALWRITCLGRAGEALGTLVLTAARGTVIAHEGFEIVPASTATPLPPVVASAGTPAPRESAAPVASATPPGRGEARRTPPPATPAATPHSREAAAGPPRPRETGNSGPAAPSRPRESAPMPVATPLPGEEPRRPGLFRRIFRGGKDKNPDVPEGRTPE